MKNYINCLVDEFDNDDFEEFDDDLYIESLEENDNSEYFSRFETEEYIEIEF